MASSTASPWARHVYDDGDVDLLVAGQVATGIFLVLYAALHILIVEIEIRQIVVGAVAGIIVGDDLDEGLLLAVGFNLVVGLFLGQVLLQLRDIGQAVGGRREDAGDVQRDEVFVFGGFLGLNLLEQVVVFDGVVDGCRGHEGVELPQVGGSIVFFEDCLDHRPLG